MTQRIVVFCIIFWIAAPVWSAEPVSLKTQQEKISYALGVNVGNNLKQLPTEIHPDLFIQGFRDAQTGSPLRLGEEEMRSLMTGLQKELAQKQAEHIKQLGEKNKKEGEAFLAENKKKEGVKTLASGLQYKVIKEGNGPQPKVTDKVTVHYRGTLIDGTEFDSSYRRGEPATFQVNGVIPGWTEALQLMKVGSQWQLFLPSSLAYGERGAGPKIGPYAVLIFTVELLAVN